MTDTTRLSRLEAARVVARRDFHAILFSCAFLFFLLRLFLLFLLSFLFQRGHSLLFEALH